MNKESFLFARRLAMAMYMPLKTILIMRRLVAINEPFLALWVFYAPGEETFSDVDKILKERK